ncbi:MAG: DUF5996 family protein [Acidimicrobiales bacterium]
MPTTRNPWPELPSDDWHDTLETLHLWTQIIGKIRMVATPWINHSWSVPLYVSPTGLRTSLVPHDAEGFEWSFDFLADRLTLSTTTGETRVVELGPRSVADFFDEVMAAMGSVAMPVEIHPVPNELPDVIPFGRDTARRSYDGDQVRALWRALLRSNRVFTRFRAGYLGKASPVHFFWGSFDLAVTRFSGRAAPPHGGGVPNFPDDVAREAYSHEVTSVGLWPGNRTAPTPIFYAYAYPTPDGFADATVAPDEAFWLADLGEFALSYPAVAGAADPDAHLMAFLESTHAAAADLAGWDRTALECDDPRGPDWFRNRPHD